MSHIVLGMTGSIAMEKALTLVPLLQKQGHVVDIVLTDGALHFTSIKKVHKLLGKQPHHDQWESTASDMHHIELAKADLLVIVPATANTIAKIAHGIADNLLTTLTLANKAPILVIPAMNPTMYSNVATQQNIITLQQRGITCMKPAIGKVACGDEGVGRMPEVQEIMFAITDQLARTNKLKDKKIVITTGGTREYIDPVRYVGNESSGTMGYELAKKAFSQGAVVTLLCANCSFPDLPSAIKQVQVITTKELLKKVLQEIPKNNVLIMAAAVADYSPLQKVMQKIKKQQGSLNITLEKTLDILLEVQAWKKQHEKNKLTIVGFAAETERVEEAGKEKLQRKELDYLVANKVPEAFGEKGMINGYFLSRTSSFPLKTISKKELACLLLERI